jgi:predicted nucleic acid-binding protein
MLADDSIDEMWAERRDAGLIGICPVTELELLYSAQSKAARAQTLDLLETSLLVLDLPDDACRRARQVQEQLTDGSQHRCASVVDLLVAATAQSYAITVLHCDRDFETIAAVTGQSVQRVDE